MSDDLLNEFKQIEQQVEKNKTEKVRLEERLKGLQEEREKLLKELSSLGIKEDELEATITNLDLEIRNELDKCKEILNA